MKTPALPCRNLLKNVGQFLFVISFLFFALFFITGKTYAQDYSDKSGNDTYSVSDSYNTNPEVELNIHNGVQIIFIEFLSAVSCQLSGFDPSSPDSKCLGVDPKTGKIGFVENGGGAIAAVASLIDVTFTPPVSSTQYIAYLRNNFGITKSAFAASPLPNSCVSSVRGVGFCGLQPLLPIWEAMRNIVYLIFILVFMIIGIGIMLRIHIDPRTVMTIQNQIPKIIVGIVAITFSFAIAGFLIDIMWVSVYLFSSVIQNATSSVITTQDMINVTHSSTVFNAVDYSYPGGAIGLAQGTAQAFKDVVKSGFNSVNDDLDLIRDVVAVLAEVAAFIFVFIAILVVLLRLLLKLIITYLNIIMDVVFAPWWILAGLLPGGPLGLSAWLRDLVANLAVFPVAISFLLLGSYFVRTFQLSNELTSSLNFPLMGDGGNPTALAALIGFGFILMLPNLLTAVRAAFKTPNLNFGPIMSPIGTGINATRRIPGTTFSMIEKYRYSKGAHGFERLQGVFGSPLYSRPLKTEPSAQIKGGGEGNMGKKGGES